MTNAMKFKIYFPMECMSYYMFNLCLTFQNIYICNSGAITIYILTNTIHISGKFSLITHVMGMSEIS